MALIETGDDISSIKLIYIFNLVGSLIYPMLVMGALVALAVMVVWIIWNITRSVKGLKTLKAQRPILSPKNGLLG
jgi:uncharacterized membrane protein